MVITVLALLNKEYYFNLPKTINYMTTENQKYEPIDLSSVLEGYEDKWVIISDDYSKVIKSGNTLDDIKDFVTKGIIMLVPNPKYIFTPLSLNGI